jgi:hypothetical protein
MPDYFFAGTGDTKFYININARKELQDYISSGLDLPVHIDAQSSLVAQAELKFGNAKWKKMCL